MTEVLNAKMARDRCLVAMIASNDIRTRRSLWRAAIRYNRRAREGDLAEESGDNALLRPRVVGGRARFVR